MFKRKLPAALLMAALLLCLLPAAALAVPAKAQGETVPAAAAGKSEVLTVAENESVYAYEGMTVYNNGGIVYNSLGAVYNNGGTVYLNGGTVYNNTGTVYANTGSVYNIDGTVYRHEAEVYGLPDGSGSVLRYYELRFADYYAPYVDVEGVTTEPGAERMIIGEDQICRISPKSGYTIAQASSDAGEIVRNGDGSISLTKVDADTVLALKVLPQPADGTYNCA